MKKDKIFTNPFEFKANTEAIEALQKDAVQSQAQQKVLEEKLTALTSKEAENGKQIGAL